MTQRQGRHAYRHEVTSQLDVLFPSQLFHGLPQHGNVEWTPKLVVWMSVIMFWLPDKTLEQQFTAARHIVKFLKPQWKVPLSYAGFVVAQQRVWQQMAAHIVEQLRPDEAAAGDAWRLAGWLVLAVDGSRFECPRTTANEEGLRCAGRQKTSPQVFHTLLQHVGTGLPWDFRLGPGTDSERRHLDDMLAQLPEQSLLTADSGFISYDLCVQLITAGQPFVLRIGGNHTLLENLDDQGDPDGPLVGLWPQNKRDFPPLRLRRIRFTSTGGLPVVLMTNVLDASVLSDQVAREIYQSRWGIEVYFRHLKQTMDFAILHSRTPATAFNEQRWRLISFWVLQRWAVVPQIAAGLNPRRFSAASARREIREVLQLMQQGRRGRSLMQRLTQAQTDPYQRRGRKTTRVWPRKKNDHPPHPPKTRPAQPTEIRQAKRLGFISLIIS